jgi:hypothetical protein
VPQYADHFAARGIRQSRERGIEFSGRRRIRERHAVRQAGAALRSRSAIHQMWPSGSMAQ